MNKFEERFNRWKNGENYWDIVGKPFGKQKTQSKKLTDEQRANLNQYLNSLDRFDVGTGDSLKIKFTNPNLAFNNSEQQKTNASKEYHNSVIDNLADKSIIIDKNGIQYNIDPSAIGASNLEVTTPEVVVQGYSPEYKQKHYASSYDRNGAGEKDAAKAMMFGDGLAETAANGILGSNILTDNSVKKTYNHIKNKQYTSALLSGLGDVLDASMLGRFLKQLDNVRLPYLQNSVQYLNPRNSALHLTNNTLRPLYIQSRTPLLEHKA